MERGMDFYFGNDHHLRAMVFFQGDLLCKGIVSKRLSLIDNCTIYVETGKERIKCALRLRGLS